MRTTSAKPASAPSGSVSTKPINKQNNNVLKEVSIKNKSTSFEPQITKNEKPNLTTLQKKFKQQKLFKKPHFNLF